MIPLAVFTNRAVVLIGINHSDKQTTSQVHSNYSSIAVVSVCRDQFHSETRVRGTQLYPPRYKRYTLQSFPLGWQIGIKEIWSHGGRLDVERMFFSVCSMMGNVLCCSANHSKGPHSMVCEWLTIKYNNGGCSWGSNRELLCHTSVV